MKSIAKWEGPCSIEGCEKPAKVRGWCKDHYKRWLTSGDPRGKYGMRGEGCISRGYRLIGKTPEHRLVMERFLGRPLRDDEVVHHISGDRLDNRPENLMVMTQAEHMRLHKPLGETCGKGHPFTPENTYWRTKRNGSQVRACRTCRKAARRSYYVNQGR